MKDKSNIWQTNDFYSAVLVRASGVPLHSIENSKGKFAVFKFDASPDTCEAIIRKHWDRSLRIESRLLIETINEMKTRLHERMKELN